MVASGDRHRLAHARAVVDFHDGGGSVDELLERLRLAEADARDSAAARAASSPADDVDVDGVAASRAATHAESDAFHDAFALRANLAWALLASGRAAASAEVLETLFREIDAVAPRGCCVCAMLVRAARRTGRLERAARVLDRAEAIVTRAEAILPRAAEADATLTDATARLDGRRRRFVRHRAPRPSPSRTRVPRGRRRPSSTRVPRRRARGYRSNARGFPSRARANPPTSTTCRRDSPPREESEPPPSPRRRRRRIWNRSRGDARPSPRAAAATRGHAADATRLLMDVRETYLASASGCSNLARRFAEPVTAAPPPFSRSRADEPPGRTRRDDEGRPGGGRARGPAVDAAAIRGADGRTTRRRGSASRVAAWKTPSPWLRLAESPSPPPPAPKDPRRRARRSDYDFLASPRGEESIASDAIASSDSFSRACGCLDVADALFSARARVAASSRARCRRRRPVLQNRAYAVAPAAAAAAAPARARRDALATRGWMGRRRRRERKTRTPRTRGCHSFGASKLDALDGGSSGGARAARVLLPPPGGLRLLGATSVRESKRITRDAAARDDADLRDTHARGAGGVRARGRGVRRRLAKRARRRRRRHGAGPRRISGVSAVGGWIRRARRLPSGRGEGSVTRKQARVVGCARRVLLAMKATRRIEMVERGRDGSRGDSTPACCDGTG